MPPRRTLRFAGRVLRLLERAAPKSRLAEYYGWLCDYRQALANWTSEQAAAEAAVAHVRRHGLRCDTAAELDAVWSKLTLTPGGREVAARLRAATERESAQAQPGETRVGCTEVLESTFGKLKRLAGSYSGNGFTTLSSEPPCTNSAACSSKQPTPNQIQHEAHATPSSSWNQPRHDLRTYRNSTPSPKHSSASARDAQPGSWRSPKVQE